MPKVLVVAGTVLLLVVAGVIVLARDDGDDGGTKSRGIAPTATYLLERGDGPPREFLYLDPARTMAYLSQFQGGLATLETSSASHSDTRSAEISAAPSRLSRELQAQDVFERSVTPTTASQFINLAGFLHRFGTLKTLPRLSSQHKTSGHAREASSRFLAAWHAVHEGDFVRLTGRVIMPRFVRLYQIVRQSPKASPSGRMGTKLFEAIGRNPRFPLAVTVNDGTGPPLRLILPMQYSLLAAESSLVVGRVTVIGKVLYRIHPKRRPYRDLDSWTRFRPTTLHSVTPQNLLARLRLTRRGLRSELLRYRTVQGPAAIILPLAVYK